MAKKAQKTKKTYKYLTKAVQFSDGSRKYFRAKTQEELDEKVLKAQILVKSGVDICSEETFANFAQMWYDLYKKPYLRKNSLNSIKYVLNDHILPYIGSYRLRDITPMQIQFIIASLSGKSNSLQSKVLVAMRNIFNVAQENGLIVRSPVSSMLKPMGKAAQEKKTLTVKESLLLLNKVQNTRARTFLLVALHTGMRRGEIIGLQWEDIDFKEKVIHVRHNTVVSERETTVSEDLKTNAAKRNLPLSEELEEWLVQRKNLPFPVCDRHGEPQTSDEIFLSEYVAADRTGAAGYTYRNTYPAAHLHYPSLRGRTGY